MGLAGYKRHPEHKKLSLTKSGMRQAENEKNGLVENWEPWCDRVVQTLEAGAALTKRASFMSITNYKVKESLTIRTPLQSNDYTQEQLRYDWVGIASRSTGGGHLIRSKLVQRNKKYGFVINIEVVDGFESFMTKKSKKIGQTVRIKRNETSQMRSERKSIAAQLWPFWDLTRSVFLLRVGMQRQKIAK